ncbi:serine/threonine-protein kinase [Actinoplanes sp. NPDC051470]|uniref:serine/threonine-protein kinase n=1 Tax=unclassified Actinoplanes TaxID=2626549 RepID=UPI003420C0EE
MSIPARIGRYRVERRLGSGAFATVWLATDDALESQVAIKVLADNWSHHPDVRARFEQEAQILRRADSERLVRIHDYGELPDGRPYQVMTYVSGGTLADRLAAGPMGVREALRTAAAIARATTDLHDAGVLHRDLKPSNVLLDPVRGRVLVADLGLAKTIAFASGFTVAAGTPGYMAPEQARPGGGLDVRADVHAIGAMAYQMITSTAPDGAGPTAPSRLRAGVPRRVDRVVLRALATQRDRRWPTAAALADALDAAAGHTPRRFSRLPGVLAGAACLSLLTGATADPSWVRVTDTTGNVSIAVPPEWAGQAQTEGWNPDDVGLRAGRHPGLAVAADLTTWRTEYGGGPGVFAGTADTLTGARLPQHPRCARQPDRPITTASATGTVTRWTGCAGTSISYSEVRLGRAYIQIKQTGPDDHTDELIRGLYSDAAGPALVRPHR